VGHSDLTADYEPPKILDVLSDVPFIQDSGKHSGHKGIDESPPRS